MVYGSFLHVTITKFSISLYLISIACILLSNSAVNVQDSHVYKNTDITSECISLIFELRTIFLSFQMVLSFARAAVVWADLASTSGLDPSSATIAPKYLKLLTQSSLTSLVPDFCADAIGLVCHLSGLFCTDLHAIGCRGAVKAFN